MLKKIVFVGDILFTENFAIFTILWNDSKYEYLFLIYTIFEMAIYGDLYDF